MLNLTYDAFMLERITLTFAQSLDGKIAALSGQSRYISESGSLLLNQQMRKDYDAILVGIGTLLADNPLLTCRLDECRSPIRVILDSSLRIPLDSQIVQTASQVKTCLFYSRTSPASGGEDVQKKIAALERQAIALYGVEAGKEGGLDLKQVLNALDELKVRSLMVEGGSAVLTSFVKENLWDDMAVVTVPKIIGAGIPAFGNIGIHALTDILVPRTEKISQINDEICWHLINPSRKSTIMSRKLYFTAPKTVEIRTEPVPLAGKKLFTSRLMGISPGTEKQIYLGNFQHGKRANPAIDCMEGNFSYPFSYGYINVLENNAGARFFGFLPHAEHFVMDEDNLFPLKDDLDDDAALFLPLMETAVSIIHDSRPRLGDRVLIVGGGVVGTLVSRALGQFMGMENLVYDTNAAREQWYPNGGFCANRQLLENHEFDLCIEASGSAQGLQTCLDCCPLEGRVIAASWYGEKDISLNLGGGFHWKRLELISSQVSNMARAMGSRWDKKRRLEYSAGLLKKIHTADLLTHRFPFSEAGNACKLLENNTVFRGLIALTPGS
ncbi:MAG: hypothetical protein B0D92_05475 [Spirochaeta sp. LUC14_002_19_P3]|nr:MAG: hypothetical protein B0D92_05475 [Spirochaeta sp. LUC14_002_19_P3]